MTSSFNADAFLQATTTAAHDTKVVLVPEGVYSMAQVTKIDVRKLDANGDNPERYILEVSWGIQDEAVKKLTGMTMPTVRQSIWLDTTPTGGLDHGPGKNVSLGRLREAVGQNKANKPWSMAMLNNATASLMVGHRMDKKTEETYAEVKRLGPPGAADAKAPPAKKAA